MLIRTGILHIPALDSATSDALRAWLRAQRGGAVMLHERAVQANRNWIAETIRQWCDEEELDLLLTVGGTLPAPGPSALECTPEATLDVLDRLLPGLPETMRAEASASDLLALLDRGVAGIRSRTLVINLPEGGAALLFLESIGAVIPAILAHLQGAHDAPRLAELAPTSDLTAEEDEEAATLSSKPASGLDAAEFAAFLRRKQ